jgi:hypothetical protein
MTAPENDDGPGAMPAGATIKPTATIATEQITARADDFRAFITACNPAPATGKLFLPMGIGPHWTDSGKYVHTDFRSTDFRYPDDISDVERAIEQPHSVDIYVCPNLFYKSRTPGSCVGAWVVHADWDGGPADQAALLDKVRELNGFAVASGTPGHVHVYVPLASPVLPGRAAALYKAVQDALPPGSDKGKHSVNDLLRPPGTLNHKSVRDTGEPTPVTFLIRPGETRWDPDTLERHLVEGGSLQPAQGKILALHTSTSDRLPAEVVDLTDQPDIQAALDNPVLKDDGIVDRSETIWAVLGACLDGGLRFSEAGHVVRRRPDLVDKLGEVGGDDLTRCWMKLVDSRQGRGQKYDGSTLPPVIAVDDKSVHDIEYGFWESRESLRDINTAALARMAAPWAVLAHCVARALALACPRIVLPPLIGGPGSLNWFGAVTAVSGGGKGAASATASALVPMGELALRNLGSGEGMITAYQTKAKNGHPEGIRESVMFIGDEVDTIAALGNRTGSTTMAVIRSGFSGETLGFSYVAKGRDFHLPAGTYRMTMVLSVQPARAGVLLGDHGGGTPQRFMWFPGTDSRVTADPPHWTPSELKLPNHRELARSREILVPESARLLIVDNRVKAMRGESDALDGHALFCREKFAYGLAILDNRMTMTEEDWELSGIAAAVSTHTRTWVADQLAGAEADEATRVGTLRGITNTAALEEQAFRITQRTNRVRAWVIKQITETGGLTDGELRRRAQSRDRPLLPGIVNQLAESKVVQRDASLRKWVIA